MAGGDIAASRARRENQRWRDRPRGEGGQEKTAMQVYSFDGKYIGSYERGGDTGQVVIRAPSGELLRVRSDAVYERDGDRLVLVCYAETLPYWLVHESAPGQDRSRDGGSEPEFERREAR
jgi:hypothetical protein